MSVTRWGLTCALCVLLFAMLACKFSFSTANLSSLKLSKDKSASSTTSSFSPTDTVYAVAEVSNAPGKLKLKGRLTVDNVQGETSGKTVAETSIDLPGSGTGTFTFTPNGPGWPNGSYKVEVNMLNEEGEQKDQKTATFTVTGGSTARPTAPSAPQSSPSSSESTDDSGNN